MSFAYPQLDEPKTVEQDSFGQSRSEGAFYRRCARFSRMAQVIWKRRKVFLRRLSIAVALSIVVALVIPARYTATVTLMPPSSDSMSILNMLFGAASSDSDSSGGSSAGSAIGSMLGLSSPGQLYVHAAQSRTLEDRMITLLNLEMLVNAAVG